MFSLLGLLPLALTAADLPAVSVCRPIESEWRESFDFTGRIEASQSVEIRSRTAGFVSRILFNDGSAVKKGDLLFELDGRTEKLNFEKAKSDVARAEAQQKLARAEWDRLQKLAAVGTVSQQDLELSRANQSAAEAGLVGARAALEHAQLALEFCQVFSPINGKIGRRLVDEGNRVTQDSVLAMVVDADPARAVFEMDERTFLSLRRRGLTEKGPPVELASADDATFSTRGELSFVDNQIDAKSGTIRCHAMVSNAEHKWVPGQFVRVRLITGDPKKGVLVPATAVTTADQPPTTVWVVTAQNRLESRSVTVAKGDRPRPGFLFVTSGLKATDQVVVDAKQPRLRDGMDVTPNLVERK